ncbi:hypothetical protein [Agarivorans sp. DSG3-1]|uniref:hypothetical protein n=1 Tax=Agarivorans sp. DSG3-1 TaxID=3342249 RepID=UPI00398EBDF0
MNNGDFLEKLKMAVGQIDLENAAIHAVKRRCQLQQLDRLANVTEEQLATYITQVVKANWLDHHDEVDSMELDPIQFFSLLLENSMADVSKLLRFKALNKLK